MQNHPTILVTARNVDPASLEQLRASGAEVRHPDLAGRDPTPEQLPALLENVDAWIIGTTKVDGALLSKYPKLLHLARRGVGYDAIDVDAARAHNRVVTIAAGGNGPSVADHALALMLAVSKQLVSLTQAMRAGTWSFTPALELHEKTIGIVGLGRVGRLVARRLRGFDARILATDILPDDGYAAANGIERTDLPTLLRESDIVTLHAPQTPLTTKMINAETLAAMKAGAILINTARGGLVDEPALLAALTSGHLAGAGLDVFEAETNPAHRATADALVHLPNVVATPHSAAGTREGLTRSNQITVRCVLAILSGAPLPTGCLIVDGRTAP